MSDERKALVLLATGADRPGIVEQISGAVFEAGANLEDSRMAILGGEFALIVLVTGPDDALAKVESAMRPIGERMDLMLQFKQTVIRGPHALERALLPYRVTAVAMDHPGIVHKVARVLASEGINVVRLDTSLSSAPTTGTPIFALEIDVDVPANVSVAEVRSQLAALGERENIDIEINAIH